MHIVFISHEYPTPGQNNGGVGTMIKFIAEDLAKRKARISVVGTDYKNKLGFSVENGVHMYRLPPSNRGVLNFFFNAKAIDKQLLQIHKEFPISAVEVPELGLAFLNKVRGIQYVVRMNGGHHFFAFAEKRKRNWKKAWMERRSFAKADHIIAVSAYVRDKTKELMGWSYPVTIINNPVDTQTFSKANSDLVVPGRLTFVGSIVEKKGIRQLIMAMPEIRAVVPHAHLVVVGRDVNFPGTKTPYRPYLNQFLPDGHEEFITFTGPIPHHEVASHIEKAEVCVYPSHMEALPLAWLEALGMGKPFVGGATGPGPEVVKHGETGLLADPYSPKDIAKQVISLLKNSEKAKQLGEAAYNDVQSRFAIDVLGAQNFEFYHTVTQK
jgi:glycosyltransferase involved in cell wall biosynthesis